MLGLAEFLHGVRLWMTAPGERAKTYAVLRLKGEAPEEQIRYAARQYAWRGNSYIDGLFALTDEVDEEHRDRCLAEAERHQMIACRKIELEQYLSPHG